MGGQPPIPTVSLITFTTPGEMTSTRTRFSVASHIGKQRRPKRNEPGKIQREKIIHSFLNWKFGASPAFQGHQKQLTSIDQNMVAASQQPTAEQTRVMDTVPASLNARPSLQQCKFFLLLFLPYN
jgi:hypothetical protein